MNLVITMSRRFGTGASVIANELSEKLGIPVYNKADIEHGMRVNNYDSESDQIRELAKSPCIILGRCASEILKNQSNVINIYVSADKDFRVNRIMQLFNIERIQAEILLEETDRQRAAYYFANTGKTWGDVRNYQIILNTSDIGIENCANVLMRYFEMKDYI